MASVRIRKCSCGSSWCKTCFKSRGLKKISEKLDKLDWKRCRHVTLSVKREKGAKEIFDEVRENKGIRELFWNIERTYGRKSRYLWILEWHKDGYPHWHVIIELEKKQMIGGDVIRKYWNRYGVWVKEDWIKNEEHWNKIKGYLGKNGYFEDGKEYQNELPEWALLEDRGTIRKWGSNIKDENKKVKEIGKKIRKRGIKMERKEKRKYLVVLEECGSKTDVYIECENFGWGYLSDVPFKIYKEKYKEKLRFEKGVGLVMEIDDEELEYFEMMEKFWVMNKRVKNYGFGEIEELKVGNIKINRLGGVI